ncbi:6838_t:CDS:2 [Racocetra fulgida]|uniref:Nucleoside diphosphate kinase n=1 Tax=Racocetra fulgida TaxID=60492 RepID=A0A9N9EWE7_9GLOM|nr:6838_t:CDS:2 [Racocetra fulgida]
MIYVHPTFRILIVIVTVITLFSIFDWLSDRPENDKITVKSENFTSYSITAKMSSEPKERTYIMVKPDGVERGLVGEIIKRFENKGYKLVALQLLPVGKDVVKTGRRLLGETDPLKSAPGTIRGDFCIDDKSLVP